MQQQKIVFITGASSGIGYACAHEYAKHGYQIILAARRVEKLQNLAQELAQQYQTESHILELDVSQRQATLNKIAELPQAWQAIDVLINNAGLARGFAALQKGSLDDWDEMIDTNLKGLLYVTKAILPGMVQRNVGYVVNIGSIAGHECYPNGNVYAATKHAVAALSKSMRMDLLGTQVRVSAVDPGMLNTEFSQVRFHGDKARADQVYHGITPLDAADVADAVYYCTSRPQHVTIEDLVIMPTQQASATLAHREN